jgi:hypothetical protein
MPEDMVNSPSHYNQSNIECIDAIRAALGEEGFVHYCRGNSIKYNWRAGHKLDGKQDLQKAAWYSRMASGDDPRFRASAPNLAPVHGVEWSTGGDENLVHSSLRQERPVIINTKEQTVRQLTPREQASGTPVVLEENEQLSMMFCPPECDDRD